MDLTSIFFMSLSKPCIELDYSNRSLIYWARVLMHSFRTGNNGLNQYKPDLMEEMYYHDPATDANLFFPEPTGNKTAPCRNVRIYIDKRTCHLKLKIIHYKDQWDEEVKWFFMRKVEDIKEITITIKPIPGAEHDGQFVGTPPKQFPTFKELRDWVRGLSRVWYPEDDGGS